MIVEGGKCEKVFKAKGLARRGKKIDFRQCKVQHLSILLISILPRKPPPRLNYLIPTSGTCLPCSEARILTLRYAPEGSRDEQEVVVPP